MSKLELKHSIQKGDFRLEVDTSIPSTGVTGVFGESGSGKTTLLRCIAGLEGSQQGLPPVHQRRVGYVFQEPTLFAHLSVRKNIEYGKRRNSGADVSVDEIVRLLEITDVLRGGGLRRRGLDRLTVRQSGDEHQGRKDGRNR